MGTEKNFAPRVPALIDVTNILAHEMANDGRLNLPHQVCCKNKSAIQGNHHVQPAALAFPRNLSAQRADARGDTLCGKRRSFSRLRNRHFAQASHNASSAITIPARVLSSAANSAATLRPRAHARIPPLVNTGHPSRAQRLTRFSFNKRFSLCALRCPRGHIRSPGRQLRSTRGKRNRSRSKTAPSLLVSALLAGQSITLRRNTHPSSGTRTSCVPRAKSMLYSNSRPLLGVPPAFSFATA